MCFGLSRTRAARAFAAQQKEDRFTLSSSILVLERIADYDLAIFLYDDIHAILDVLKKFIAQ